MGADYGEYLVYSTNCQAVGVVLSLLLPSVLSVLLVSAAVLSVAFDLCHKAGFISVLPWLPHEFHRVA